MNKILLLISDRPEDKSFATEVASVAGLTLMTAPNAKAGVEVILAEGPGVIFVDTSTEQQYEQFESAIQETIGLFSDRINSNNIYFISTEDLETTPFLVQSPLFGHFIHRNYGSPAEAGQHYGKLVGAAFRKQIFGLGGLLAPGAKIQVVKLSLSSQKQDAVEAVRAFVLAAKFQTRMATVIANAVDEILMNAIFDAPVDDLGRPAHRVTSRAVQLKLEDRSAVEMHVGYDGKYVAVSAVDAFGSLDKVSLLSHISKMYTGEEYKVKASVASAGIGLATIYRAGASMLFASEHRVKTEVTVFFKRTDTFREFKDQFRFISTQFFF